ncbi:hypothetical protein IMCC14465_11230 [alpha proteobacterium IMCC14465]|uniref:Guanylate cyclase domain-containing protein n=1 Tax=alpha proteobacterium IMCC14465 TaxID=1220535 RepID=J9DWB9_9PROT|nr:hypothetical protein IMCC14465_11230 [alpha proteobacterium IMCC14465]
MFVRLLGVLKITRMIGWILPLIVLVMMTGLVWGLPRPLEALQNAVFDQYNRLHPRSVENNPVFIIDIDEKSLELLGQFPWPRQIFSDIISSATASGAAAIGIDVMFAEPDRNSPSEVLANWKSLQMMTDGEESLDWDVLEKDIMEKITDPDAALAAALRGSNTVLSMAFTDDGRPIPQAKAGIAIQKTNLELVDPLLFVPQSSAAISNLDTLHDAAAGVGLINAKIDSDGLIRSAFTVLRHEQQLYPALSIELLRVAQGARSLIVKTTGVKSEAGFSSGAGLSRLKVGQFIVPVEADGSMRIYYAERENIKRIPAWKVVTRDFDPLIMSGKIGIIGSSAAGLLDNRATPIDPVTPGVEIHLQAIQQIVDGQFLTRPLLLKFGEIALAFTMGLLIIILIEFMGLVVPVILWFFTSLGGVGFSWWSYTEKMMLVDPANPIFITGATLFTAGALRYIRNEEERRGVRNAFGQYLAPELVEAIAKNPKDLQLGGVVKPLTVMFTDIRDFTSISEGLSETPQLLTHLINRFLTTMSGLIYNRQGTIDKYIGDCIMAFWNAPTDLENHERLSCLAALDMQKALKKLNQSLKIDPELQGVWSSQLAMGIGLNTGETLVGNIGSDQRFNYSALGDAVNVAARLEGQTKFYGVDILLGAQTAHAASDLAMLEIDLIALKGKEEPERIYVLMGDDEKALDEDFISAKALHNRMIEAYQGQNWGLARGLLNRLETVFPELKKTYRIYSTRIDNFRHHPPSENWNGVYVATQK